MWKELFWMLQQAYVAMDISKKKFHEFNSFSVSVPVLKNDLLLKSFIFLIRHMLFAPSLADAYGSDVFPSIYDSIYNYKRNETNAELVEEIKLQISIVTYSIHSAMSILKEPIDFERYV